MNEQQFEIEGMRMNGRMLNFFQTHSLKFYEQILVKSTPPIFNYSSQKMKLGNYLSK